jgi:hypothetical protein
MIQPFIKYEESQELWRAMEVLGATNDPEMLDRWQRAQSPLRGGRHAAEARAQLEQMLTRRLIAKQIMDEAQPGFPDVNPKGAAIIGDQFGTRLPVAVDLEDGGHWLIFGRTGCGKTTLLAAQADQSIKRGVFVTLEDFKCEGRRLTNRYANVAIFRPDQMPINMLEPVGRSETYWLSWSGEFSKAFNLRPETWTKLPEILSRMEKGMKAGDPYPSLKDFERILFILAEREGRQTLQTAAQALASLNAILGKTALIRKAPCIEGRYAAVVYEYQGLPPRIQGFLAGVNLLRLQLKSSVEGHNA